MLFIKDSVLKSLIALLGVFIIGYASIISIHFVFGNIINSLDKQVKNEQARYQIGEYIVKEISSIERQYYQMTMSFTVKEIKPIQKKISKELEDIQQAIDIIEKGGTLKRHIQLNLVGVSQTVEHITYTPDTKVKYTFEAIDLSPKLKMLGEKMYEMENIIKSKDVVLLSKDPQKVKQELFKIKLFYKQIPAIFIRMKENASRLLYESKQQLKTLQKDIDDQKQYYKSLEISVSIFIMMFVFLLGYVVIKQILEKSKELAKYTKEAELAAKEAKIANETKSRFLANMSHEIRTPLNAIIGFSEILTKVEMKEEDKEKASIIVKSAKALLNIINDILDISKVESGKFEITPEKVDLKKSLSNIVELFAVNAKQKEIRLIYTYEKELPTFVDVDETRIKQVISNILSNAIKFTQTNGSVTFHVKVLEKKENTVRIRFAIKDKGIGISLENQRKIFEPFSQADNSVSKQFGGTGLGLAISMKLIQLMDSKIELLSKEGEGSTFYFDLTLPYYEEENKTQQRSHNFYVCSIIDDNESLHQGLLSILNEFGTVYQADSNIENIDSVDLIFCFGDKEYFPKLFSMIEKFNAPLVYVGKEEKVQEFKEFKELIRFHLDLPLLPSKVYNIIAEACEIEKQKQLPCTDNVQFNGDILVAEDNTNNQLLIRLLLEEYGLNVEIVENGQEAVQRYKQKSFDLLFLDINMPVMDGLTALKEILKLEKTSKRSTPKIALTANSLKGDKEKYIQEGMDNYISKPIDNEKLAQMLLQYLPLSNSTQEQQLKISVADVARQFGVSEPTALAMVEKMKKNLLNDIEELQDALNKNKLEDIKRISKNLKSICINISFDEAHNLIQDMESKEDINAKQTSFDKLKAHLGDITKL